MFSLWDRIKYNFKGLDELAIKELQERVENIEKLLEKLPGKFEGLEQDIIKLSDKFTGNFKDLLDKFDNLNNKYDGLKDELEAVKKVANEASDKAGKAMEMAEGQEKIMLTCCIVASVVALAAIGFIGFCIYQGVKLEREKEKNLSQDKPNAKLDDIGATDGTEKYRTT